ncbi:unnamed protein product, partial [Lampetra planeri]
DRVLQRGPGLKSGAAEFRGGGGVGGTETFEDDDRQVTAASQIKGTSKASTVGGRRVAEATGRCQRGHRRGVEWRVPAGR